MHLKAQPKPGVGSGPFTVSNAEWSMTGDSLVEDYDWATGTLTRLNPASFNGQNEVTFYYSIPQASRTIHVKATLTGPTGPTEDTVTATYDIAGPTMVDMTGDLIADTMSTGPIIDEAGTWLHHGDNAPGQYGIFFYFFGHAPSGGAGTFAFTQLVYGAGGGLPNHVNEFPAVFWALDNCPNYGPFAAVASGSDRFFRSADGPAMPMYSNDTTAAFAAYFIDFLMYRPDGEGSIWIPFGAMVWGMGGIVDRDSSNTAQFGWDMRVEDAQIFGKTATSTFPTWPGVVHSPHYGSCNLNP
ncbi:MAG: hypothetical protein ACREL3_05740 [Gemmatimonadales bacterium]